MCSGERLNKQMSSYQYRDSHYIDLVLYLLWKPPYLERLSLYQDKGQVFMRQQLFFSLTLLHKMYSRAQWPRKATIVVCVHGNYRNYDKGVRTLFSFNLFGAETGIFQAN